MIVTIDNATRTAVITDDAITKHCKLDNWHPEEQRPWKTKGELVNYIDNVVIPNAARFLSPIPTQQELDDAAAVQARADQHVVDRDALLNNGSVTTIMKYTPAQIDTYVDNNVTDMASAQVAIKHLMKICAVLCHAEFGPEVM